MRNNNYSGEIAVAAHQKHKERDYWLKTFSGEPAKSSFPCDFKNAEHRECPKQRIVFRVSGELFARLSELSKNSLHTLHIILAMELVLLLYKYTGDSDIIIGTPIYKQEFEKEFLNTALALRNPVEGYVTVKELLLRVRRTILGAVENQNYPVDILAEELGMPVRENEEFPLFNTVILLENIHDRKYIRHITHNISFHFLKTDTCIEGVLEYHPGLYKKETVERIASHFTSLLRATLWDLDSQVRHIDMLPVDEKRWLREEVNRTECKYPGNMTIPGLFEEQARENPHKLAIKDEHHSMTYRQLDEKSNRVARYLRYEKQVSLGEVVGILIGPSTDFITAILGVMKAGGTYVFLDPLNPEQRLSGIIDDAGINVVISRKEYIKTLNRLQWECGSLGTFLCLNSRDILWEEEVEKSEKMDEKLWHYIGETAVDEVTGGGWFTSYTGEPFTRAEMNEYGENALKKITPILHENMRVLEIGCASGITMFRTAPKVGFYYGTDLSSVIIEKNKARVQEEGHRNITLACVPAHEIERIGVKDFDLIIINSVIQSFHGHNYLRHVLRKCVSLLGERGYLFIGDVMDQDLKKDLIREMTEFKAANEEKNVKTKTDWSTELFVSRSFFEDLSSEIPGIQSVEFSRKIGTIENELTKFRFDTLVTVDKTRDKSPAGKLKHKYQDDLRAVEVQDNRGLQPVCLPDNPAYIIYTSGTTGQPKGVLIKNKSLVNYSTWFANQLGITGSDKSVLTSSPAFDLGYTSIYPPLLNGGELHVVSRETFVHPEALLNYIRENDITYLKAAPSLFTIFVNSESFSADYGASLRAVVLGGEPINTDDVRKARETWKHIAVMNSYGPAETTVGSVARFLDFSRFEEYRKKPTVGKPIANARVYILNKNLELVPMGITGEICIGGDGVGVGYLNRPQLTAEKFIPNPFAPGDILYRTGDLARWLPDGNIEFLGRIDTQVKIKGYRIELGEIEDCLQNHERVKDAVVLETSKKENKIEQRYLCAYIVSDYEITVSQLMEYLLKRLPDYMCPTSFVKLKEMPLTGNGKVDRKSLRTIKGIRLDKGIEYAAPRNKVEKKLVEAWEKVLNRPNIGIDDNFFMTGGDSIKSIQIASRMNKEGYKLDISDIFQYPVISKLATKVKKLHREADQSTITGMLPLTPIQQEFFQVNKIDPHHYNQSILFYSEEGFDEDVMWSVLQKIQEHHDALRMTFTKENGSVVQTNHGKEYALSFEVYDLRNRGDVVEVMLDRINKIQAGINLENGPLMKSALFHLDDGDRLLITVHHLVIDGVSWRILLEDIETLYRQYQKGESPILAQKSDSFKLWAKKMSEYADSRAALKEIPYWRELEAMEIPPIERDFDVEKIYRKDTDVLAIRLDEDFTERLLTKVNMAFGTEINDILLTALALATAKIHGHHLVKIALEGHGREKILENLDINRTVGWFTVLYPIVLDISYRRDLARQLKEIKETLRRVPNKGIGYGILKHLTDDQHKTGIDFGPEPQIRFNYLGQFDEDIQQRFFEIAKESHGYNQSPQGLVRFELDVSGIIMDRQLAVSITYSKKQYKAETIRAILEGFKKELIWIITFCSTREGREFTPSDFTYKKLSIDTVDTILAGFQGNVKDIYPLTPMQQGILFHALYDDSLAYFEQMSYRLHGEIRQAVVAKSLNRLLKRYDVLRTVFIYEGVEHPLQVVLKERKVDFHYGDIRGIRSREEKEGFIKTFKEKDRQRYFQLDKDVLLRVALIRISDRDYEFIWSYHHILIDGWCRGILTSEYFEIYNSYVENRSCQLPDTRPYSLYIQWLEKKDKEKSRHYWSKYLENYEEAAVIPRTRTPEGTGAAYRRDHISLILEKERTADLNRLAAGNSVTLNIIILTVWGIILGKYTGKQDVVFGTVVSGRPSDIDGVESMVGIFINTVPVRISFEEDTPFSQLLQATRQKALESESHNHYPLAEIQSMGALNRNRNLVNHVLVFQNYPVPAQNEAVTDLEFSSSEAFININYDFGVIAAPGDQLSIIFEFNADKYEKNYFEAIAYNFDTILHRILEDETQPVGGLLHMSVEEENLLLLEFNADKENEDYDFN